MAKREISEINAGSMADIAFLLLIFFLVTTTMDTDTGLLRRLPPPPEDQPEDIDVKQRNIFEVLVNANDQLLADGEYIQVTELKAKAKEFIKGDPNNPEMPEFKNEDVPIFGNIPVSKQIVSLQNDNGTSYQMYIKVQNELISAYREIRNERALKEFGKTYDELVKTAESSETIANQAEAIKTIYPQRISEAEPKAIGGGQ
ncbi:MAG: ExbD/TolR family protein [Flavobacteriales bacterium]